MSASLSGGGSDLENFRDRLRVFRANDVRNDLDEFGRWHDARGRIVVGWVNPHTGALTLLPNGHKPYDYEPAWEVVYGS